MPFLNFFIKYKSKEIRKRRKERKKENHKMLALLWLATKLN